MRRFVRKWAPSALVVLVPLVLVGLPALAQHVGNPAPSVDLNRAKERAALIQQGQMNLRDATALAEKHAKGTALEAVCEIQSGESPRPAQPMKPEHPGGVRMQEPTAPQKPATPPGQKELPDAKRLIYQVSCFANEKLVTVRIDGLTKKVLDMH